MNKLIKIDDVAPRVKQYVVAAPDVARHCLPGQFVIVRVDDEGERVPFTICDYDRHAGTITLLVQDVGYSTHKMGNSKRATVFTTSSDLWATRPIFRVTTTSSWSAEA